MYAMWSYILHNLCKISHYIYQILFALLLQSIVQYGFENAWLAKNLIWKLSKTVIQEMHKDFVFVFCFGLVFSMSTEYQHHMAFLSISIPRWQHSKLYHRLLEGIWCCNYRHLIHIRCCRSLTWLPSVQGWGCLWVLSHLLVLCECLTSRIWNIIVNLHA